MATIVDRQVFSNFSNFTVDINGTKVTVIVTASAAVLEDWINTTYIHGRSFHRMQMLVVGLSMDPHANTIHLCVDRRCLIFRLSHADYIPQSLRCFLWDFAVKFAGFYNRWHCETLMSSKHRLVMYKSAQDLTWMKEGFDKLSAEGIIQECLGFKVELKEDIRTSDWNQENLSDDQVLYACVQSHCAFAVGLKIKMWNLCF